MQITCPGCHFTREIPDGKAPPNATLATCPKCKLRFKFRDAPALRTTDAGSFETRDGHATPFGGSGAESKERGRRADRPISPPRSHDEPEPDEIPFARVHGVASSPAASGPESDASDEIQPLRETMASTNTLPEQHARMGEDVLDYAIAEERARIAPSRPLSSRKPVSPEDADALMGGPPSEPIAPPAAYAKELAEAGLVDPPEDEDGERPQPLFEELSRSLPENHPHDDLLADVASSRPTLVADRLISAFEESADGRRRHPLADTFLPPERGREDATMAEAKPKVGFFGRKFRASPNAEAGGAPTGRLDIPGLRSSAEEHSTHRLADLAELTDPAGDVDRHARRLASPEEDDRSFGQGSREHGKDGKHKSGRGLSGLFRRPPAKPDGLGAAAGAEALAIPGLHSAAPAPDNAAPLAIPGLRGGGHGTGGEDASDAPLAIPGLRRSAAGSHAAFSQPEGDLTIPGLGKSGGKSSSFLAEDDGELAIPGLRRSALGLAETLDDPGDLEEQADARSGQTPFGGGGFLDRLMGRGDSRSLSGDIWQDLENLGDEGEESSAAGGLAHAEPAPWEDPRRGLIGGFLGTAAGAMFAPARFFGRLSIDGGPGRPILFVAALAEILALVHFLLNSAGISTSALLGAGPFFDFGLGGLGAGGLLAFATYPVIAVAALTLMAMYRYGMLALVGSSEGGFSGAVRVLAYGAAPFLLLAAPVIGLPLALPWSMAVTVVGFRAANRTSYARVAVACVLPDFLAVFLFLYAALSAGVIP